MQDGYAEVEDLNQPVSADHEIGRLDVAVHDVEGRGHLGRGRGGPGDRPRVQRVVAGVDEVGEGLAVHQLHNQVDAAGRFVDAEVVYGGDTRQFQACGGADLAQEPFPV